MTEERVGRRENQAPTWLPRARPRVMANTRHTCHTTRPPEQPKCRRTPRRGDPGSERRGTLDRAFTNTDTNTTTCTSTCAPPHRSLYRATRTGSPQKRQRNTQSLAVTVPPQPRSRLASATSSEADATRNARAGAAAACRGCLVTRHAPSSLANHRPAPIASSSPAATSSDAPATPARGSVGAPASTRVGLVGSHGAGGRRAGGMRT